MTPLKLTIPLLLGLYRAHLATRLKFYGRFKILPFFVVLIWLFLLWFFHFTAVTLDSKTFALQESNT